jgi:hypothetical protein
VWGEVFDLAVVLFSVMLKRERQLLAEPVEFQRPAGSIP